MATTRLSPTAATTEAVLVRNTLRLLGDFPYTETHSNDPPNPATSLTVVTDATTRFKAGNYVDWVDDATYDIALLTAVAATTLTVTAGQLGSTASDHATGARFRYRPRFFGLDVQKAVNDAIAQDLWPDCYAVYQTDTPATPSTAVWYSLNAAAEDVIDIYQKSDSSPIEITAPSDWTQPRYTDSTLSSTQKALRISGLADPDNTVFITWTRVPAIGDLSEGMARLVEYGACRRLLEWEGSRVVGTDASARNPGQHVRDARWFAAEQDRLRATEKVLLARRFPQHKRTYHAPPHYRVASAQGHARFHA